MQKVPDLAVRLCGIIYVKLRSEIKALYRNDEEFLGDDKS